MEYSKDKLTVQELIKFTDSIHEFVIDLYKENKITEEVTKSFIKAIGVIWSELMVLKMKEENNNGCS